MGWDGMRDRAAMSTEAAANRREAYSLALALALTCSLVRHVRSDAPAFRAACVVDVPFLRCVAPANLQSTRRAQPVRARRTSTRTRARTHDAGDGRAEREAAVDRSITDEWQWRCDLTSVASLPRPSHRHTSDWAWIRCRSVALPEYHSFRTSSAGVFDGSIVASDRCMAE